MNFRLISLAPIFVLTMSFSAKTNAQTLAHDRCQSLGKGMNISNWLERGWDGNWPTTNGYSKPDLEQMQEAGISSIRLPIYFHAVVDTIAPYAVDTTHLLFDLVDSVIQWTDELDMKLLIDNHHGWELTNDNWRNDLPRFSHLWSVVAQRYMSLDPDRVMFELMNEPALFFSGDSLLIMYLDAIDSIRQHTTNHSIVISPEFAGIGMVYGNFEPLQDTNLIYTWHSYDPLNFTHQGLTWHDPFFPSGRVFPISDTTFFDTWFYTGWERVLAWKETYDKPLFLGEFGLSNYCDSASSCNWLEYTSTRLVLNDIPWMYWDWQWDFSMFKFHVISEDSIYPCFKHYLGLYGDNTFTGIANQELEKENLQLTVYPNPIGADYGTVTVLLPKASGFSIKLFNSIGVLIDEQKAHGSSLVLKKQLNSGMYLIVAEIGDRQMVEKLVVY